jgi:uncharacterized protein (TIGR03435 family)
MEAYAVQGFQIFGPAWVGTECWDMEARAAGMSGQIPSDQFRTMFRAVIEDRFQLRVHREMKEMPVYVLLVGDSGPKLIRTNAPALAAPGVTRLVRGALSFEKGTIASLARQLSVQLGRMVIDRTDLKDEYDVTLEWRPEPDQGGPEAYGLPPRPEPPPVPPPPTNTKGPSIFTAVQEQLGLRLDSQKGAVEVLVIDRVRKPSDD